LRRQIYTATGILTVGAVVVLVAFGGLNWVVAVPILTAAWVATAAQFATARKANRTAL
jgi:hypothetical protein